MKIAIVGSRGFKDLEQVTEKLQNIRFNCNPNTLLIISGGAKGVDEHAVKLAKALSFETKEILPDFSKGYDVGQYHKRNAKIVDEADKVIAFWDGKSTGTHNVIMKAIEKRKNLEIVFDKE